MFFVDIEDVIKYLPVNSGFNFKAISVYLIDIDRKELRENFSRAFVAELQADFNGIKCAFEDSTITALRKELIDLIRNYTANLAFVKWLPIGQVNISQAGVQITSTENAKTAFQWQIDEVRAESTQRALSALEDCLDLLRDNIDAATFSTYKASNEFKELNSLFVYSARDFKKYCSIFDASIANIKKLSSVIRKVEDFDVKPVLLPNYFAEIKATLKNAEALGANAQAVVDLLKPAIINLAVAKGISELSLIADENGLLTFDNTTARGTTKGVKTAADANLYRLQKTFEADGRAYLDHVGDYLVANIDNYPTFKNDPLYQGEPIDLNATGTGSNKVYVGL